jgi:hypothetical protein
MLALSFIGMEWWVWGAPAPAVPMSLNCGVLLAYWGPLLQRPAAREDALQHADPISLHEKCSVGEHFSSA